MNALFKLFLLVDIYALAYFISGLFLSGAMHINVTTVITGVLMSFTYTKSFKNPYSKVKEKTGIVIASIIHILVFILLLISFQI